MPQVPSKLPAPGNGPTAIVPGPNGTPVSIPIPLNAQQVDVLRQRVSELTGELNAANSRRNSLSTQLNRSRSGVDQAGIESRISQLDGRILGIEADIAAIGRALSAAPNGLSASTISTRNFGPLNSGQLTALGVLGIIFVLAPLAFAAGRIAIRRAAHPPAPQIPKDVSDRLERMEQGIDAVAVELERIGEGQRFVTQLMADRAQRAALPEGVPRI